MNEQARTRAEQTLFELREQVRDAHAALKDVRQSERDIRQAIADGRKLLEDIEAAVAEGVDERVEQALNMALASQIVNVAPAFHRALDRFADDVGEKIIERSARELHDDVVTELVKLLRKDFDVQPFEQDGLHGLSIKSSRLKDVHAQIVREDDDEVPRTDAMTLIKAAGWPVEPMPGRPHTYRVRPPGSGSFAFALTGDRRAERNAIAELRRRGIDKAIETAEKQRDRDRQQALQNGREAAERKAQEMVATAPRPPAQEPEIVWLSLDETAEALGVSNKAVAGLIRDGKLAADKEPKPSRYGYRYRIAWPDVMRYAQDHG